MFSFSFDKLSARKKGTKENRNKIAVTKRIKKRKKKRDDALYPTNEYDKDTLKEL